MVRKIVSTEKPQKIQQKKPVNLKTQPKKEVSSEKNDVQIILDSHTKHLVSIDETLSSLLRELADLKRPSVPEVSKSKTVPVKSKPDISWHSQIDPDREYSQKEIITITKISQPTLSMAKVRGHIVTRSPPGERGWVVKGSDLVAWDSNRAVNLRKQKQTPKRSVSKKKTGVSKTTAAVAKPATVAVTAVNQKAKKPLVIQKKEPKALIVQDEPSSKKGSAPVKKTQSKSPDKTRTVSSRAEKTASTEKTSQKQPVKPKKPVSKENIQRDQQVAIPDDIPDRITALTMKKVVTQTQFGNDVGLPQKVIYEIATKKLNVLNPAVIQKIVATLKTYEST